jgi:novel protein kinase C delta type
MHSNRIIYRDLKPENIVLSMNERGHLKLVDFGFAKKMSASKSSKTRTNCGTPAYIAPEILKAMSYSYEVDVWSFGVLMVEIISGQSPF